VRSARSLAMKSAQPPTAGDHDGHPATFRQAGDRARSSSAFNVFAFRCPWSS
jgi:hypothetical protein